MRYFVFILCALLTAGCAKENKEYTVIREVSRPVVVQEEVQPALPMLPQYPAQSWRETNDNVQMYNGQTYNGQTYNGVLTGQYQVSGLEPIVFPQPAIPPRYVVVNGEPVMYYEEMPMTAEMVVMGEVAVEQPVPMATVDAQPVIVQQPMQPEYVISQKRENISQQVAISQEMEHCVVVLQHPQGRDLVRCLNTDLMCIQSYEKLGYVQLRYTPHFSGSKDVEVSSDYPVRQWRSNNNIPRW